MSQQSTFAFDQPTGRQLRDEGIKRSVEHANQVHLNWAERALGYVREYAVYHETFMGEDVRMYAEQKGFEKPLSKRAWGGVMMMAARKKIIVCIGTRKVKNERAHCANANLWKRVV